MDQLLPGLGQGKSSKEEQVSPHKISLIVLIHEYCMLRKPVTTQSVFSDNDSDTEVKFSEREKRDFMVTILQLLQSSDLTLKELCIKIRDKMKTELYVLFLKKLQEFVGEGVGAMKDYVQNVMRDYFQNNSGVERTSVLGLFIRRMVLAFEKLSFTQVTDLYRKFERYYVAGVEQDEGQSLAGSLTDSAMSLSGIRFSRGRSLDPFQLAADRKLGEEVRGVNSQRQAEYFIQQQVFLLQHNPKEALPPADLQEKILEMLEANPELAEAHFLSYLNSLRVKEYCTAVHNLFHYFDRKTIFTLNKGQVQVKGQKEGEVHRRYAALNLAALHYRFGHKEEALAPLQEAIGMAQDANDNVCLQHALGWLHRLSEQGTAQTENLLERAVAKSSELMLPNLMSIGVQACARHNAFSAAKPCQVFEYLQKSDMLNCQHSQSGFMCTSFANKAALWHMYGKRECTSMLSQMILHLDTTEHSVYYNGESVCIAMCNLARIHAQMGQYNFALDIINCAKKRFPKKQAYSEIWMQTEQEVLFERTILNRKFGVAELAVLNLKAFNPLESQLRHAILCKEKGDITPALTELHKLLETCQVDKGDHSVTADFKCRVYLELGSLYRQTGNASSAQSYILESMTLAKTHHLEYMTALGAVQLASVQLMMQLPHQALTMLYQYMLSLQAHGTVYDQANYLMCYVKCKVAIATRQAGDKKREGLLSCVNSLNRVTVLYQNCEAYLHVKNPVYLLARLYHELGFTERNRCSHQYRQIDQQYPTLSHISVDVI
ncbi:anaphase-promoting complex subunit 5-like isoform X3 [Dreissena polymorpha]|uniref:anaphase-promoting complex subunit 5-like isoform X3 n=1 Tax=Dreissena polymorpha TaxID=45954 RepID=UPI0022640AF6|nr:anaphase-promoting complex subunit 5-like isoform X3 [Dreissena polymorpha]